MDDYIGPCEICGDVTLLVDSKHCTICTEVLAASASISNFCAIHKKEYTTECGKCKIEKLFNPFNEGKITLPKKIEREDPVCKRCRQFRKLEGAECLCLQCTILTNPQDFEVEEVHGCLKCRGVVEKGYYCNNCLRKEEDEKPSEIKCVTAPDGSLIKQKCRICSKTCYGDNICPSCQ